MRVANLNLLSLIHCIQENHRQVVVNQLKLLEEGRKIDVFIFTFEKVIFNAALFDASQVI